MTTDKVKCPLFNDFLEASPEQPKQAPISADSDLHLLKGDLI
jgi:hypothetical protein